MMMDQQTTGATNANPAANPFGASTNQMFNDFERVKTEQKQSNNATAETGASAGGIPGMGEGDLNNMEQQFMGMFQNIAKQMENMQDGEGDDDDDDD